MKDFQKDCSKNTSGKYSGTENESELKMDAANIKEFIARMAEFVMKRQTQPTLIYIEIVCFILSTFE